MMGGEKLCTAPPTQTVVVDVTVETVDDVCVTDVRVDDVWVDVESVDEVKELEVVIVLVTELAVELELVLVVLVVDDTEVVLVSRQLAVRI